MALDEQEADLGTKSSENSIPIRPGTQEKPSGEVQQVEMQGEGVVDPSKPCLVVTVTQNVPQIKVVRQPSESDVEMSATLVQPIQEGEQADQVMDSQLVPPSASFALPLPDLDQYCLDQVLKSPLPIYTTKDHLARNLWKSVFLKKLLEAGTGPMSDEELLAMWDNMVVESSYYTAASA
ncbi:hypothetical protein DAPPUDRAFT_256415 [Daphnia pulex]|uniref:Uncharacterized protein n=1 Tax=Daphnia pulex TaxID=6669 RepID=E9HBB7_DAPPU|nr:hypothetical protein DAPPUDRAFT_256415 [Daphnia pulex]|eukprot:EFX70941.1 hypothetical protein DAPPUDRAFT_256415 [Daphnia pulex]